MTAAPESGAIDPRDDPSYVPPRFAETTSHNPKGIPRMKDIRHLTIAALALIILTTGCANHYVMRLNNGSEITTRNRPKLDKKENVYRYKNADGKKAFMPAVRVSHIEPQ